MRRHRLCVTLILASCSSSPKPTSKEPAYEQPEPPHSTESSVASPPTPHQPSTHETVSTPPPEPSHAAVRSERVVVETALPGIEVGVVHETLLAWKVTIKNGGKQPAQIKWDESSFVAGTTESLGRLLRGSTKKMDAGQPQPATPLPNGSSFSEVVVPERALDAIKQLRVKSGSNSITEAAVQAALVDGARLNIVVQIGSSSQTWTGRLALE